MRYRSSIVLIGGIILFVISNLVCGAAVGAEHCSEQVGTLVSIEGSGELQPQGQQGWQPVKLNDKLCAGDVLRVGPGGRAAVTLTNETILRINQNSILTFSLPEERISVLKLLKGMLHIFSHRPRALKVSTPYVNGTVEGTEFLVAVDDQQAAITVFEGLVRAANGQGSLDIGSGQSVTAAKGTAPQYSAVVNPRDAVQWTLYYPTILASAAGATATEADKLVSQASGALQTGQVAEARSLLDKALSIEPQNSNALALLAIIDVVQNRQESALAQAQKAVELAPDSAAAGLALSYAQQATFDIDGALNTLLETTEANPNNVEVLARLAELQLAVGRFDQALATIDRAVGITPDNSRVKAVHGFVHLTRVEIDKAQASFTRAVELDQAMPLARLGLGLSQIRRGQVAAGRAEIEIGAALDTSNSMIRSYLGKAFFEERRDSQAGRQYSIAKELDPADPTPWFYDAIRKQTDNRPVEALHDLQQSIALNNNRAVYRSRFQLDDDLAARSASLGRIYQDLG
ncbi:tetratricopeptide repeat protein, partial [Thermodesulfobacteriota bacterium]